MPELTAVQFMTENLQLWCAETPIMSITVLRPAKGGRYALHGIPTPFIPSSIYRRGKHTVLANEEGALIVSYNLSGKIFRVPKEERAPAFRIRFDLGSHHLIFSDRIGLGRLTGLPAQGDTAHSTLQWFQAKRLGDEPWPAHRSGSWWKQRCDSRSPIHTVLIDQRRVAGIGNILALEGLFRAGIHPATKANLLSLEEWNQLAAGIHHAIALSHRQHQRARANQLHHNPEGYRGELDFVSEGHIRAEGYVIYGRKNEPCPKCGALLLQGKQSGRPMYWCQQCQPSKG